MRKINLFKFIKFDFSFVLIFVIALINGDAFLFLCFSVFLLLHEFTHFFVAKKLGYMAGQIRLNFFGASLEGLDDFLLFDEIKIVLSAPLLNLFFAGLCYIMFWFEPESFNYLGEVLTANLAIFFFNMLPIYPLDAGRVLLALLSIRRERTQALRLVKIISFLSLLAMFMLFIISFFTSYDFVLGFVTINLFVLAFKSAPATSYKRRLFAKRKFKLLSKGLICREIYLKAGLSEISLFKHIDDYHYLRFVFVDENFKVLYSIDEVELYKKFDLL